MSLSPRPGPARIVSLVPSLTEAVCWFGLGGALVGRTRFCAEPAGEVERIPVVGGTKDPSVSRIAALQPDLVIANREENRREDVEALRAAGLEVLVTDPNSVEGALTAVTELGFLLGREEKASELVAETRRALAGPGPAGRPRVFVPIWKEPLMGLGAGTYGHDLIERCGAINVLGDRQRYPAVTREEVVERRPGLVLLPDEPYPFGALDAEEYAHIAPARVIDGKLLWWYGPRMPESIRSLKAILSEVEAS